MKKITFLLLFALFSAFLAAGQIPGGTISGTILSNETGKPLEAATLSLFKTGDSVPVKINASEATGKFVFDEIETGKYFIKITSTGLTPLNSPVVQVTPGKEIAMGLLKMETAKKMLEGITIQATKPFIERKIDRTIINVDASITNAGTTLLELLEKTPGISVDKDGNVSLKGKPGVTIMLDGKPSYLSGEDLANLLRNMPSSNIDQIEIMTNPPAKFDAAGNSGVINIKMKRIKKSGLNGSVSSSFSQSQYLNTNQSINLNYNKGKMNFFGNYSYSYFKRKNENVIHRRFYNPRDKVIETIFDQGSTMNRQGNNQNLQVGMDYNAGKKTTYGVVLSGYLNPSGLDGINTTRVNNAANVTDSIVLSESTNDQRRKNFAANGNFRHLFDTSGREITVDLDYLNYSQESGTLLVGNYLFPDYSTKRPSSYLKGSLPSDVTIYSAKSDLVFPLKKAGKLEAGIKSSYVTTDNEALYKIKEGSDYVTDYGKTNHFIYTENINAAYLNYSKTLNKWGFQAGLRAENTHAKGHQKGNSERPDSSFTKDYTDFFPTAYVSFAPDSKNNFRINYGRRTDRPSYQDLNPFYYFLDEYTYGLGNTLLQPQFSDNFELTHSYKNLLTTTLNYSRITDAFTQVLRQITSERKTYQTTENLATKTNYGIAVSSTLPVIKSWTSEVYANMSKTIYTGEVGGGKLNNETFSLVGNINNRFTFKKGWSAELSGFYHSKMIEGQIVILPSWRLDAGVQKRILKNKGSLKLSVRDIFSTSSMGGYIRYQDIDLDIKHVSYPAGRLTFTYRFGKPAKNTRPGKARSVLEEQERIK